jgi:hypothetical protein
MGSQPPIYGAQNQAPPPPFAPPPASAPPPVAPVVTPKKKGLSCWGWGCIISGILAVVVGGGIAICCGGPAAFVSRLVGGYEGMMAVSWLQSAQTQDWQTAGTLTVGGAEKAKTLAQRIEGQVGRLKDSSQLLANQPAKTTKGAAGTAEVRVPVLGDRASGTAVFRMKQEGPVWMVEDDTVETAP